MNTKERIIELLDEAKLSGIMALSNQIKHSDLEPEKKMACYDALIVIADLTGDLASKTMLISRTRNTK